MSDLPEPLVWLLAAAAVLVVARLAWRVVRPLLPVAVLVVAGLVVVGVVL